MKSFEIRTLGSRQLAIKVAERALTHVEAYQKFVSRLPAVGRKASEDFEHLPLMDKASYVSQFPLQQLFGDDIASSFALIASSGSSGKAMFWPQLRPDNHELVQRFAQFLEAGFKVHQRRTLVVVGLALGSWIGGDFFSWSLKNVAASVKYPLCVLTTGSRHEEIVRVLAGASAFADQILLVVCPSAIGHLHLLARNMGVTLPHEKLRYLVLGEPFPEVMRMNLASSLAQGECPMLSIYGSADTGLLGVESVASAALRTMVSQDPELSASIGMTSGASHLFHFSAHDAYVENVDGELVVTKWQGVPLVRYNLHDATKLFSWRLLREHVLSLPVRSQTATIREIVEQAPAVLPDIIAISGRSDRCVILCGTNLSESMLQDAVAKVASDPELGLSGVFNAWLTHHNGRQRLAIRLEMQAGASASPDRVYERLVTSLGEVQPEFHDDWVNVYQRWDTSASERILDLSFVPWPGLSHRSDGSIKAKGLLAAPPKEA